MDGCGPLNRMTEVRERDAVLDSAYGWKNVLPIKFQPRPSAYKSSAQSMSYQPATKKQATKFSFANFQKRLSLSYIILRIQRLESSNSRLESKIEGPEGKQCRSR